MGLSERVRWWVSALIIVAGCGEDRGPSGDATQSPVSTGLPSAVKLSSLSAADAEQVCVTTAHALNTLLSETELHQLSCAASSILTILNDTAAPSADDIPRCESLTLDCLSAQPAPEEQLTSDLADERDCALPEARGSFMSCDASVADYERCAAVLADELRERLQSIRCEALQDITHFRAALSGDVDLSSAAECDALSSLCPDFAFGTGTSNAIPKQR